MYRRHVTDPRPAASSDCIGGWAKGVVSSETLDRLKVAAMDRAARHVLRRKIRLVEGGGAGEHAEHVHHARRVPLLKRAVQGGGAGKHPAHAVTLDTSRDSIGWLKAAASENIDDPNRRVEGGGTT